MVFSNVYSIIGKSIIFEKTVREAGIKTPSNNGGNDIVLNFLYPFHFKFGDVIYAVNQSPQGRVWNTIRADTKTDKAYAGANLQTWQPQVNLWI